MTEHEEIYGHEKNEAFCLDRAHQDHYSKTGDRCTCQKYISVDVVKQLEEDLTQSRLDLGDAYEANEKLVAVLSDLYVNCHQYDAQKIEDIAKQAIADATR